ncbi:MAG: hypothetical protein WA049_20110 [Ferribacterium limneticum]
MIKFSLLEKSTPCPSASNCWHFEPDPAGDCTLGHEREAGSSACDFVSFMVKPASTFDAVDVVAEGFGVDARTLEGVE